MKKTVLYLVFIIIFVCGFLSIVSVCAEESGDGSPSVTTSSDTGSSGSPGGDPGTGDTGGDTGSSSSPNFSLNRD